MSDEGMADGTTSDHRHGRYILSGVGPDGDASIDGEELANACRRLGISGPLEPLMREMNKAQHHSQQQHHNQQPHHNHHHHHHHHHHQSHHSSSGGVIGSGGVKEHRRYNQKSDKKSSSKTKEYYNDEPIGNGNSGGGVGGGGGNGGGCVSKTSTYGQESWGRDSGARDLSPEPSHMHGLQPPASSGNDSQLTDTEHIGGGSSKIDNIGASSNNTASMLHLANKLQVAALSALKTEVLELSARLQNSERERECMQRKLSDAVEEKDRAQRRLEAIGAAHESRITEMHCVIVELNKKLKSRQENAIIEEHEPDGSVSDLSFQDGSVYNSEMECTNLEQESQTEPLDIKLIQPLPRSCDSPGSLPPPAAPTSASTQIQIQAMHEEILHLRGQVALLQSQLASDRDKLDLEDMDDDGGGEEHDEDGNDISNLDNDPNGISLRERSAYTSDDLCETAEIFEVTANQQSHTNHQQSTTGTNTIPTGDGGGGAVNRGIVDDMEYIRQQTARYTKTSKITLPSSRGISPIVQLYGSINSLTKPISMVHHQKTISSEMPITKMAERVRLRRTVEDSQYQQQYHHNLTGTNILNSGGICTTEIAEHLVADMLKSDINELGGGGGGGSGGGIGGGVGGIEGSEDNCEIDATQIQTELQRLHRRIEHIRIQNSVLSLTLAESKAHCNHLYLLCGKYESNAVALHQALHCSDRAIEAYDVMLALLESRLAILENNTKNADGGNCVGGGGVGRRLNDDNDESSSSAFESRKAAEAVAKHLMDRLESGEKNLHGTSFGPWQDAIVISANSSANSTPWTNEDDRRLRGHVSKLKGQRASIQNTVVNLESPFCDSDTDEKKNQIYNSGGGGGSGGGSGRVTTDTTQSISSSDARRMDLEMAVLMQELMSMREELIDYKYRTEQAEREKNMTIQRLSVMQEALLHLQAQLADSEALLATNNKDRTSYSEAEHSAGIERELVEALARESRLKARLQGLAGSVEAATKSSEEKYIQVQNTVAELKQTNISLTQSLDRCKRKYQSRLRRLEQQMLELSLTKNGISPSSQTQLPQQHQQQIQQQHQQLQNKSPSATPPNNSLKSSTNPVPETTL